MNLTLWNSYSEATDQADEWDAEVQYETAPVTDSCDTCEREFPQDELTVVLGEGGGFMCDSCRPNDLAGQVR